MLTEEELTVIRDENERRKEQSPIRRPWELIDTIDHLLAEVRDLRRYRDWCRRLVVAAEFKEGNCFLGPLADEVRAALEGK